jgi:amino acid transporter
MDQVTTGTGPVPEDEALDRFGYRQQFVRSLRHFESFAVAFSFISITTGIFTTYAFALATGGTRSIWTWLIVVAGQSLVALVYGALSVRVGFAFLIALAYATNKAAYASTAPVASIVHDVLGGVVQKIFLVFVCVSIFACGLIIMVTNGRLIFSMARDRRLPGHQFLSHVPRSTAGPSWATVLAAVLGGIITLVLRTHAGALSTLFTASTIMPALLYSGTVLLYVFTSRRPGLHAAEGTQRRPFGKMEIPVIAGAVIWLAYELIVLIGPSAFRDAQYYVLGSLGVGLVFYVVQLITEPRAMRTEPGQEP